MHDALVKGLTHVFKNGFITLAIFVLIFFVFTEMYEKLLAEKMRNRFRFFRNPINEKYIVILLVGLVLTIIAILIKMSAYDIPLVWLVLPVTLMIGGLLGLVPFSFFGKEARQGEEILVPNKSISKSMGIWALLSAIIAFLVGFFVVFRNDPRDIPIAIVMGLVCSIAGVLLGLFLGMALRKKK
jgi:CHASE2 domain-containing sensor protein